MGSRTTRQHANLQPGVIQLNTRQEGNAMSILKFIEITGESRDSWARAGQAAFEAARETIRMIRHIEVTRLTARVDADGSLIYQTTIKLAFHLERPDTDENVALQQAVEIVAEEPLP
jgi:flavin-binding protein dodecin